MITSSKIDIASSLADMVADSNDSFDPRRRVTEIETQVRDKR